MKISKLRKAGQHLLLFAVLLTSFTILLYCDSNSQQTGNGSDFQIENRYRDLERVFLKAERGEPIVIAAIGGSITQGALASSREKTWFYLIGLWWEKKFPNCKITLTNAGIGATGSAQGAIRVRQYLEFHKPDLVFIEFAVNDYSITEYNPAEAMEGLIRQIQSFKGKPAVILLCNARGDLKSEEASYLKVAEYYNVPVVSMLPILTELKQSDQLNLFFAKSGDIFHPSDKGHNIIAQTIIQYLDATYSAIKTPIKPLISDKYENSVLLNAENLMPTKNSGWFRTGTTGLWWGDWWQSNTPGSTIMFEIEGTEIGLMFHQEKTDLGTVKVTVDDLKPTYWNAYWQDDWGGGMEAFHILASNLERKKHVITVELLREKDPKSNGYTFMLKGFSAAGASDSFCRDANKNRTLGVFPDSTVTLDAGL